MEKYDHQTLENKWRQIWDEKQLYAIPTDATHENKKYVLPQLPYPSGAGLHVGHAEVYTACDIYARYLRMQGSKVFEVIGWDAFGLPAENYAIKTNIHPRKNTDKAIETFTEQIKSLGIAVDWTHSVGSHQPEYYKWTQWFFLLMFERGLAYRKKQSVNWCDTDKTVLANEQVIGGKCERCGSDVIQREMEQWYLKITEYADRLYDDLDKVDWPSETVKRQRDWIGRSEGALITFSLNDGLSEVEVFTTRPDTIFGATVMVLSPEHKEISKLLEVVTNRKHVEKYIQDAAHMTELQRQQQKEKTGMILEGVTATNPANGEKIPVFIADYVIATYGTGAIMAVPAHDERDGEFAVKFGLPIQTVVTPVGNDARYVLILPKAAIADRQALESMIAEMQMHTNEHGYVQGLRLEESGDLIAIVSADPAATKEMQEYWIKPGTINDVSGNLTIIWEGEVRRMSVAEWMGYMREFSQGKIAESEQFPQHAVIASDLFNDVDIRKLLEVSDIRAQLFTSENGNVVNSGEFNGLTSEDAKSKIVAWLEQKGIAKFHKTYKLRDWSVSRQRFWGAPVPMVYDPEGNIHPVKLDDLPVHLPDDVDFKPTGQSPLTYSPSFQGQVEEIYGKGWRREVDTLDTFMCSSWYYFRYLDPHNDKEFASPEILNTWMPVDFYLGGTEHVTGHLLYSRFFTKVLFDAGYVKFDEPFSVHRHQGTIFGPDGRKMSKRYGNVINPTDVVFMHGADTIRIYEMFMGPLEQDKTWNPEAATGIRRFLQRIYDFNQKVSKQEDAVHGLDALIKKVGEDIAGLRFNTAIAEMMKTMNSFESQGNISVATWEAYLKLLAPFAPFLTEELWEMLGHTQSIHLEPWPKYELNAIVSSGIKIVVQVNGKTRDTLMLPESLSEDAVMQQVVKLEKVAKHLESKQIVRHIYVADKLINLVTN